MNIAQVIATKRDGGRLTRQQIETVVEGYVAGDLPDYQMSALAMAIYFQGLSHEETVDLTRAMRDSGRVMDWSGLRPIGAKHSTGGVGDKVTLPLVPALAACGLYVPKISGRGLGPTGGTLDKLESIPGLRVDLSIDEFQKIVRQVGCCISGATKEIAPADKKLYALRDVTGTVPSIPLITASILSKKLAVGPESLVVDVKWGSGAFMRTLDHAQSLAQSIVAVGNELGVRTTALLTDMNQPLGRAVGNTLEVAEALEVLDGHGPEDVRQLVAALGSRLLLDAGLADSLEEGAARLASVLEQGLARQKFEQMIAAQQGQLDQRVRPAPAHDFELAESGFVRSIDCEKIGLAVIAMGGGRRKLGDSIDPTVGITMAAKIGDWIDSQTAVAIVHHASGISPAVNQLLQEAFELSDAPYSPNDLIVETVSELETR
jgi:pyrimidine-nucleoside phosphorylase